MAPNWQLAGTVDLQPGETEIAVRGEGPGRKECDAVLISPTVTTLAGVEEICALARRLRQTPSPGQLAAVFDDGRRIEGNLVSGWRGSGVSDRPRRPGPARRCGACCWTVRPRTRPRRPTPCWNSTTATACAERSAATWRLRPRHGQSVGAQVLVQPSQEFGKSAEKPIAVETDWLRRIVFDAAGPPRRCPPRSLVCRDGRVIAFRALRFSGEGVSLLTDQGLVRLAYRDLAEVAMQPIDAWEAYHRQLAEIDPKGDAGIVRLETGQGMVFTASTTRVTAFREEAEAAASTCLVQPAWSRTPIPVAWSAVRTLWRAPATVVPLSLFAPQQVAQRGGPGQQLEVASGPQRGRRRAAQRRHPLSLGVWRPCAQRIGLPLARLRAGLPQRPGDRRRRGRLGVCRGESLRQRGVRHALVPKQAAAGLADARFPPATSPWPAATRRPSNWCWSWRTAATRRGPNADPLDIGDHADWLEPILLLDPVKLRAAVAKYRPAAR